MHGLALDAPCRHRLPPPRARSFERAWARSRSLAPPRPCTTPCTLMGACAGSLSMPAAAVAFQRPAHAPLSVCGLVLDALAPPPLRPAHAHGSVRARSRRPAPPLPPSTAPRMPLRACAGLILDARCCRALPPSRAQLVLDAPHRRCLHHARNRHLPPACARFRPLVPARARFWPSPPCITRLRTPPCACAGSFSTPIAPRRLFALPAHAHGSSCAGSFSTPSAGVRTVSTPGAV
ncbi:hypothetical protein GGX14DRAFT_633334, partial [Mycena pura]